MKRTAKGTGLALAFVGSMAACVLNTEQLDPPDGPEGPRGEIGPQGKDGGTTPWTVDGNDIYFEGGNVGIGTMGQEAQLSVYTPDSFLGPTLSILREASVGSDVPGEHQHLFLGNFGLRLSEDGQTLHFDRFNNGWQPPAISVRRDNGYVGMGSATPDANLHILDGASAKIVLEGGAVQSNILGHVSGLNYNVTSGNQHTFRVDGTGDILYVTGEGITVQGDAFKPGGGGWTDSSDVRLKKNVDSLDGSLGQLLLLRGVTFEWKEPSKHGNLEGTQIGMIAQEVEQVFPEWVGEDRDGYKTLTLRGFEALTVEALRAINDKLSDQKRQLTKQTKDLERENKKLATKLASLDTRLKALEQDRRSP
ncbi:tail fiber domain-containing protein [Desulfobulbus sp. AH-315-M07]|nr:tail fiber domain-containing protein [Desulfobulbus sp. AH-315-M07]